MAKDKDQVATETAVMEAPAKVSEVAELEQRAEAKEAKRWIDSKRIPSPFRRSHLAVLMDDYARDNGIDRAVIKPRDFLQEQALPNPTTLYRVTAYKAGGKEVVGDSQDIEAVDSGEAIRVFKEEGPYKDDAELKKNSVRFEVAIVKA